MTSKYDNYWMNHLDSILTMLASAKNGATSESLDVSGLNELGQRKSWAGRLVFDGGQVVVQNTSPLTALGKVLETRLPEWAKEGRWAFRMGDDFSLSVNRGTRYWKLAAGEGGYQWDEWKSEGFVAIGWDELGDLTGVDEAEYQQRRDRLVAQLPDWSNTGVNQVWSFVQNIRPGDQIVANQGKSKVLGIGTVTGKYYFVEGQEQAHRLPVTWDDLDGKVVDQPGWQRTLIELEEEEFNDIAGKGISPVLPTDRLFIDETFQLLDGLYHTQTAAFYQENKEEFQEYLEQPFKVLVAEVADRLPPAVTEIMETRKRVVARILKNDFGQGGAWPHYWGAFYPKGSKRAKDAQLSIFIDRSFMEFGFYIGEYGSAQRQRLQTNCETHYEALCDLLAGQFEQAPFLFGDKETYVLQTDVSVAQQLTYSATWRDFLRDPSQFNCDVSLVLSKDALLETSREELVETAVRAHKLVFPLILLAVSDDPLPAIVDYLGLEDEGEDVDDGEDAIAPVIPYGRADFLANTHLTPTHADEIWDLLDDKKQVIFFGPPGTGKSYVAQHLARWITDRLELSPEQVEMIQFHPAYSYEDFIEGIRPVSKPAGEGRFVVDYPAQAGVFRRFCERAAQNPDRPHVFIIDEINRGNIPRIFGELMLLLEYRNQSVALPYSGSRFTIPPNVYLIATMNTADRSIALVDFALRRRFHFIPFAADPDLFERWLGNHDIPVPYLAELYRRLSQDAIDDANFAIGPSYFMDPDLTEMKLARIWRYSIEPYLEEYYVGQPSKVAGWRWDGAQVKALRSDQ